MGLFVVSAPFIGIGFMMLEEFIKKSETIKTTLTIIGWLIASIIYLFVKADIKNRNEQR